jgi:sporulation protein YlmC with PRC-barrel domain
MSKTENSRLIELDRSDFTIVKGDPDIRNWDVRNTAGRRIGKVDELIIDKMKRKVRYMVVDLGKNDLDLDKRKVMIPIGLAELHRDDDDVILPQVETGQVALLPEYEKGRLNGDVERKICYTLGRKVETQHGTEGMEPDPEFYSHDYYNDDNLYRHRLREGREKKPESEFEKGLRLWEKRSDGGIIPDSGNVSDTRRSSDRERTGRTHVEEDSRMSVKRDGQSGPPRNRKDQASGRGNTRYTRPGKTIEDRIRREGLRDPGDE